MDFRPYCKRAISIFGIGSGGRYLHSTEGDTNDDGQRSSENDDVHDANHAHRFHACLAQRFGFVHLCEQSVDHRPTASYQQANSCAGMSA